MNKIITISREFGSGGRELGKRLAEQLGWAYYDQEIVREIANRTKLSEEYVQHLSECHPSYAFPIHTGRSFMLLSNPIWTQNQEVFREQCNVIHEAADRSNCVIVGRCADYILHEQRPFRIFVYSDTETKVQRCQAKGSDYSELIVEKDLKKMIRAMDKNRSQYYEFFTGQGWGDRSNYDICINTSGRCIKEIAHTMAKIWPCV